VPPPDTWLYGRCSTSNWPPPNDVRRSSAGSVLRATVASNTRIPPAQFRDQSGDHVLDAAVPIGRQRQPRAGVHQHGARHRAAVRDTGAFAPEIAG
jgi:hypothetical protein